MVLPVLVLAAVASNTSGPSFTVAGWQAGIIIAAAVIAGIVTLWKFAWPLMNTLVTIVKAWPGIQENAQNADALADVAKLAPLVEKIAGQFDNNGGSSMRDAIDANTNLTRQALDTATQAYAFAKTASERADKAAVAAADAAEKASALHAAAAAAAAATSAAVGATSPS